jgi:SAM-dependent methyltransferase|tara:strand:+ start:265747 stop:266634 length:888 start_codon:yes stop_codon:yes gene_type:complete
MTPQIFDKTRLRQSRDHRAAHIESYDFLIRHAAKSIIDRLAIITLDFDTVAIYGARMAQEDLDAIIVNLNAKTVFLLDLSEALLKRAWPKHVITVQSDSEWLPFAHGQLDAFIAIFEHHSLNDLPGALIQARAALRPDGMFMVAMPGADTMYELREAMTKAELALYDGLSPHIYPFADKQQYGALMQRAGFALPVVDSEHLQISYKTIYALFKDLKHMGEGNILTARSKRALSRAFYALSETIYRADNGFANDERFDVTFEIIHMIGWTPDKSKQQQPLKPGSAEHNLADILCSE